MPGMVMFRRRWSVGILRLDVSLCECMFLFTLVDHGRGYLGILVSCLICESAIIWLSMRGSILYTQPREAVQYVLYIRLAILLVELVYAVVGIAWLFQFYQPCSDVTAKNLALGIVVCNWLVIFSVCFTLMCTFDPTGRTFVKLKATRRRQRNLTTYTLRHRLEEGQASSWSRRLKFFMCCTRAQDTQSDAYSEVASLFAEFFRDLDIVPSDIIAGLVLLRQRQRSNRGAILDQANNDILAFLSGMPVTRNTKYLDLKNSTEMGMYKEVCYYMLFALAAYGWPMYLIRKPAFCLPPSHPMLSQTVTVEEDNCCGCNVLAIRRHFLDRELKQVHVVYTSWHDAVYETPFFVAVDHGKKKVVISIRGTLSPKDALTDLTGDSERLPVEEQHGNWLGHKGMVYSAEYIKKKLEQEMILSQAFGRDLVHDNCCLCSLCVVLENYNKGKTALLSAAKVMVSPTEVDLNPETIFMAAAMPLASQQRIPTTQHRRNSSVRSCARSEISLDGFAECTPPPVPVVLRGARERLTVELRDRHAPLAVMESLSDAESLYSLDSRRSSAALRGSPMLGCLPFQLNAPIPEENPSLSSRTELLAADCLYQATPEHELGEEGVEAEGWETETGESQPSSSTPPAQLSNGNPSQAVLEFAQYLDSLFRLDGSGSPPMELSDGESESGRGSYGHGQGEGPGEGQRGDDTQLLARATMEPNLVPKPPRTFAGSADPSSGISLSPSFPLSSSGELNDLSPADGAPLPTHSLRTSTPCPYPEENTLASMV
uniref:Diacylglycerol lipase alpha n=1 Tax=Hucho hucho TaxID=62062 RepID=A0A4W5LQC7_9TELE